MPSAKPAGAAAAAASNTHPVSAVAVAGRITSTSTSTSQAHPAPGQAPAPPPAPQAPPAPQGIRAFQGISGQWIELQEQPQGQRLKKKRTEAKEKTASHQISSGRGAAAKKEEVDQSDVAHARWNCIFPPRPDE
ncbi:hypothetical protein BZA77DRAFT_354861 [Pyronema omphalodes]|nr:hypothetical protein BZA77DRAFT_354861 [Pyronema omphalodes]